MSAGVLKVKITFEELLELVDQLTPTQRVILLDKLNHPMMISTEARRRLYDAFAPTRKASASLPEDEINGDIASAVNAVRRGG